MGALPLIGRRRTAPRPVLLNPRHDLANGLVGWWIAGSGNATPTQALDHSLYRHHAALVATDMTFGPLGMALSLNGTTSSGTIGNPAELNDLQALSITAWKYSVTVGEGNAGTILTKRGAANAAGWAFRFNGAGGSFRFTVDYGVADLVVDSVTGLNAHARWQHVAVTWDGSLAAANVHMYFDGFEGSYATQTNAGSASRVSDAPSLLVLGNNEAATNTWNGSLHDVRLWNRVLTPQEVLAVYRAPFGPVYRKMIVVPRAIAGGTTLQVPAVRAEYRVSTPILSLQAAPSAHAVYRVSAPALTRTIPALPVRSVYAVQAPRVTLQSGLIAFNRRRTLRSIPIQLLEGPAASRLLAAWPFVERDGMVALDASLGTSDGQLVGMAANARLQARGTLGIRFDGTDDGILIGTPPRLYLPERLTLTFRLTIDALPAVTGTLVAQSAPVTGVIGQYGVVLNAAGTLTILWGAATIHTSTRILDVGRSYHISCVRTALTGLAGATFYSSLLYIDGMLETVVTGITTDPGAQQPLSLGKRNDDARFFAGTLGDVRLYGRVFSADEIWDLATAPPLSGYVGRGWRRYHRFAALSLAAPDQSLQVPAVQAVYRVAAPVITITASVPSTRAIYRVSTPTVTTGTLAVDAARALYRVSTPIVTTGTLRVPATRAVYGATTPVVTTGTLHVSPVRAVYRVSTPVVAGGGQTVVAPAVAGAYRVNTPHVTRTLQVPATQAVYRVNAPVLSQQATAGARAIYRVITPVVTQTIQVPAVRADYRMTVPALTMTVVAQPVRAVYRVGTPALGMTMVAQPVRGHYAVLTPLTTRTLLATPVMAWYRVIAAPASGGGQLRLDVPATQGWYAVQPGIANIDTLPATRMAPTVTLQIRQRHHEVTLTYD